MNVDIQRFDPSTIKPHRIAVLIGKRGTGKSTLLEDLLYHQRRQLDMLVACTPTESSAEMFATHTPDTLVHDGLSQTMLEALLASQKRCAKRASKDSTRSRPRSVMLCLDDCGYDKSTLRSRGIRDLFMNGRHRCCALTFSLQYLMDMSPDLRSNTDYVFVLKDTIRSNREKLHKFFFGMFDTYRDFAKVLDACTEDNEALVLDNTNAAKSSSISDSVFWYKAMAKTPPYQIGRPVFWRLHTRVAEDADDEGGTAARGGRCAAPVVQETQPIASVTKYHAPGTTRT